MRKIIALTLLFKLCISAVAEEVLPNPGYAKLVTDNAEVLSAHVEAEIDSNLNRFFERNGYPIVLVAIQSTDDSSIEEYANELYNSWGIGSADTEEGILLLIAQQDRKLRIEVGYGSEENMTDAYASRIINNVIVPVFKQSKYDEGTIAGLMAITHILDKEFVWYINGHTLQPPSDLFFVPTPVPKVWDPENFLSAETKRALENRIYAIEIEDFPLYFAVSPMKEYSPSSPIHINSAYCDAGGYERDYYIVTYFPNAGHQLDFAIDNERYYYADAEKKVELDETMKVFAGNAMESIEKQDTAFALNHYVENFYIKSVPFVKDLKRNSFFSGFIAIFIASFIIFLIVFVMIKLGGKSSSYSSRRGWSSGGGFSSGSSGGFSSFGGGGSGGGGASGSW